MQRASMFDSIAEYSLLAMSFVLPFLFVPEPFVTIVRAKAMLAAVLVAIGVFAWTIARLRAGAVRVRRSAILAAAGVLLLAYVLSALVTGSGALSLIGTGVEQDTLAGVLLASAALALAFVVCAEDPRVAVLALRAMVLGAIALAVLQCASLLAPVISISFPLNGSALGSWHEAGIALGLFGFLGLALAGTPIGRGGWKFVLVAESALSLALLVAMDLPDVWIALVLPALFMLWYRRDERGVRITWTIFAVAAALLFLFSGSIAQVLPSSAQAANAEARPSWDETLAVAGSALSSPQRALFGTGPDTFGREWDLYKPAYVDQTQYWNADFATGSATVLTALVSTGAFGALAWISLIAALIWSLRGSLSARDSLGSVLAPLNIGALYLALFYLLYVPQAGLNVLAFMIFGVFAGLLAVRAPAQGSVHLYKDRGGYAALAIMTVIVFSVGYASQLTLRAGIAESLVDRSNEVYANSGDMNASSGLVDRALALYPSDARAHRSAVELGMLQFQQLAAATSSSVDAGRARLQAVLSATTREGLAAVSADPSDYQNWLALASLYQGLAGANVEGAYENAHAAYEKAAALDPTSPVPPFDLAQLDMSHQDAPAALKDLSTAISLMPDFSAAYYLQSQVYAVGSDYRDALAAAHSVVTYAPTDPLGWYNEGAIRYAAGTYAGAVSDEKQALALDPHYANAMYVLGLSYYQLGDATSSLATFRSLDQLDPGQASVAQIIANLQAGEAPLASASSTAAASTSAAKKK